MVIPVRNPLRKIRQIKIIYPIILGVGVVSFLFFRNFEPSVFKSTHFERIAIPWLIIAILFMAIRDIGYMVRLQILSDKKLNWRQTFRIVMLWEFTSAITPSAIGGTSVAIIFVNKEGLTIGKSSAVVMATSFLDELYFLLTFPFLFLFISPGKLFQLEGAMSLTNEFIIFAFLGYTIKFIYTLILCYGLFFNPRGLKWLLLWIFKLPILRRWKQEANQAGSEIISSSKELRKKVFFFWSAFVCGRLRLT